MKFFLRLILVLFSSPLLLRAVATADLGSDLSYLRVHVMADSVPALRSTLSAGRACVLDLRYPAAGDESIVMLRSALALHPAAAPLFILLSPATPAAVVDAINQTPGTWVSLGIVNTRSAKVLVSADAAADRRAFDALDNGTPVAVLISGKLEKERFDEATLVKEFKNGNPDAAPPPLPDPSLTKSEPDKPAPLIDRVLQRAVQLQQALLALKP